MNEPSKKESSTRWWEFYVVRYAMGTVVGAIIVFLLYQENPIVQPLLFQPGPAGSSLEATRLTLLAAYGLVFCYIASGPILVLHAGRFLFEPLSQQPVQKPQQPSHKPQQPAQKPQQPVQKPQQPDQESGGVSTRARWGLVAILLVAPLGIATLGARYFPNSQLYVFTSLLFLAFILLVQAGVVILSLVQRHELYRFYVTLSVRREKPIGDIMDSYKHLREHGNSFFIVFLEIVLGVILFGVGLVVPDSLSQHDAALRTLQYHLGILSIWILPAVFVWLIGTFLERRFSEDTTGLDS